MENVLLVIRREDIPIAAYVAKDLSSYHVLTFDPCLLDVLVDSGFSNAEFLDWKNSPPYDKFDAEAREISLDIQKKLNSEIKDIYPDICMESWQYLNIYYNISTILWYSRLWQDIGHNFIGKKLFVFICNTPGEYYLNSFVHSALLMQYLLRNNIDFSGYSYPGPTDDRHLVPDFRNFNFLNQPGLLLIHLPTCYYDIDYFKQELQASGHPIVSIQSRTHDVPVVDIPTVPLISSELALRNLTEATSEIVSNITLRLRNSLHTILKNYIALPEYLNRLVDSFEEIYNTQLITYHSLHHYYHNNPPSRILISDVSMGYHDALVSFAKDKSIPVTLLPHSKTIFDTEHCYSNITALTHPIQLHDIGNRNDVSVFKQKIAFPEEFKWSSKIGALNTISLLLNTLTLHGIFFSRCQPYFNGIRLLFNWCQENNVNLKIRSRPDYLINKLLIDEAGIDPSILKQNRSESLAQHLQDCDLCLMYDQPTTASLEFLRQSIPVLSTVPEALTLCEARIGNSGLMPPESIDISLQRLKRFKNDPLSFSAFRDKQFFQYLELFQHALPLRRYLQ